MAGEGDAERLVVLLEARIRDFEKNMAKASGTATQSYGQMRRGSKSATAAMEADMVRSTSRINQALASTSTRIGSFGKSFTVGMIAPIAGLISLQAAVNGTKAALEKFGDINDKSLAAGVDPEFFQSIAYQASLSGVEIDGVAGALAGFAKNAGLAAEGKGRMVSTLQALNPELLKNIQNATTQEQRIRLAADAINEAKSAAEAAALATALFGDQGTKLVAAFSGGADEIDRMMAKAKEMGLIVERDLIERADELGDEFDTASQIVDLKLKSALVNLAPVIVGLTGMVADWTKSLAIVIDQFKDIEQRAYINPLQNSLVAVENQRFNLMDDIKSLKGEIDSLGDGGSAGMMNGQLAAMEGQLTGLTDQALKLQERIAQLQGKPAGDATAPGVVKSSPTAVLDPNTTGGADVDLALNGAPSGAVKTRNEIAGATIRQADAVKQLIANLEYENSMIGLSDVERAKSNALREAGADATENQRQKISSLVEQSYAEQDRIDQMADAFDMLGQAGQTALEGIIDAFADGKVEGEEFLSILSNVLSQVGSSFISNAFSGASIGKIFGFADGTANTGGRRGEARGVVHGQEAVIPLPAGGKVPVDVRGMVPASQAPASMGGRLRIELGAGLTASILDEAARNSVEIVQGGIKAYDRGVGTNLADKRRRAVPGTGGF